MVSNENTKLMNALAVSNEKDKKQLLDNIHSFLNAMETTRRAAKHICHLRGKFSTAIIKKQWMRVVIDRTPDGLSWSVESSFQSTFNDFYLKAITPAQIKAAYFAGLRSRWSDVVNSIEVLKAHVHHEQAFIKQIRDDKFIPSKIDTETSMATSSKLAYQLVKLTA